MADKLHKYQGFYGRLHDMRDRLKQKYERWKEDRPSGAHKAPAEVPERSLDDYPHIYRLTLGRLLFEVIKPTLTKPRCNSVKVTREVISRMLSLFHDSLPLPRKTRTELVRISAAVMGIEFSYAAETAFVSPTLLKIGVQHQHMTMIWGLSPLLGFFVTPILGSLSDGCRLALGRRRPFILLLSLGVLIGLVLVPNGEEIGYALGDVYPPRDMNDTARDDGLLDLTVSDAQYSHPWGVFFTVLGTVLLDFDADSCQSPARAYLLDVSLPEDHARGLSTFTIMAGLGGFFGYALGAVNWDVTIIGEYLGGHVRAVFTFTTILFVICVLFTVTAFKEIPLGLLQKERNKHNRKVMENRDLEGVRITPSNAEGAVYGAMNLSNERDVQETQLNGKNDQIWYTQAQKPEPEPEPEIPTFKEYLLSIIFMPKSLRMVCLTNLFCWMSHVCYSLYFTDFVGEAVFDGDPSAPPQSPEYERYQEGVRFGCWGMAMYSLSCSCYSLIIDALIRRFRAKKVYIGGLLIYSVGMLLLALMKGKVAVILFSWTAGVMYSTLFTVPYLLVAHYHEKGVFELTQNGKAKSVSRPRGLGTDVGIVSSMVFLAQFLLALCMGTIIHWAGTTTAVVSVASFLAFCGAVSAFKVMYLDL